MVALRGLWRRGRVRDSLFAVLVWAFQTFPGGAISQGTTAVALATIPSAALVWRRDRPLTVLAVCVTCDLARVTLLSDINGIGLATLCALYAAGRHSSLLRAGVIAGSLIPVYVTVAVILTFRAGDPPRDQAWWTFWPLLAVGLWPVLPIAVGQLLRLRYELEDRKRTELADAAVQAERRHIARELHDVVAHHITTMNVLLGAARTTMGKDPAKAEATLVTAERTGREAMAEMRHLLHILRVESAEASRDAVYGVTGLPMLVARAREGGMVVELQVSGGPAELPSVVDHAVYRVVQEALTNARRHGGNPATHVRVSYEPESVEVEVLDEGPGTNPHTSGADGAEPGEPGGPGRRGGTGRRGRSGGPTGRGFDGPGGLGSTGPGAPGRSGSGGSGRRGGAPSGDVGGYALDGTRGAGGYGLRGMAERVSACGGVLETGPRPEGGFRVHARLPLAATLPGGRGEKA
ncbi:sensor histidine kinase [Sphaerisporangium flaviroseum]